MVRNYNAWLKTQQKATKNNKEAIIQQSKSEVVVTDLSENKIENASVLPLTKKEQAVLNDFDGEFELDEDNFIEELLETDNVNFDGIVALKEKNEHKNFYLNLLYLLQKGFNTLFVTNANPSALDFSANKSISATSQQLAGIDRFDNKIAETKKTGFDFSLLTKNQNSMTDFNNANDTAMVVLTHNVTLAFNEMIFDETQQEQKISTDRESYIRLLMESYKNMEGSVLKDKITKTFNLQKIWFNLPKILDDNKKSNLTGFVFNKLAQEKQNRVSLLFFNGINKLKQLEKDDFFTFIQPSAQLGTSLIYHHFSVLKPDKTTITAYEDAINTLKNKTITLQQLISRLPKPFNTAYATTTIQTTDSSGNIVSSKKFDLINTMMKWYNINPNGLRYKNENTYKETDFFISPNSKNFVKWSEFMQSNHWNEKVLERFYQLFIIVLQNIFTCVLLYENENGNELLINQILNQISG